MLGTFDFLTFLFPRCISYDALSLLSASFSISGFRRRTSTSPVSVPLLPFSFLSRRLLSSALSRWFFDLPPFVVGIDTPSSSPPPRGGVKNARITFSPTLCRGVVFCHALFFFSMPRGAFGPSHSEFLSVTAVGSYGRLYRIFPTWLLGRVDFFLPCMFFLSFCPLGTFLTRHPGFFHSTPSCFPRPCRVF